MNMADFPRASCAAAASARRWAHLRDLSAAATGTARRTAGVAARRWGLGRRFHLIYGYLW